MSEKKWTPGPWYLNTEDGREDRITGNMLRTGTPWIAELIDGLPPGMARANAHPIAAAPDLYEALWAILYADQDNQIPSELFQQAKAALDKATKG